MPHRSFAQDCFAMCPPGMATYASRNLDSMGKIANHVLAATFVCDFFLFLSSFGVSLLPNVGINAVGISFLLIIQTACVGLILNHNAIPSVGCFYPTQMVIGVALGTTMGAAVLALVTSTAYKRVCRPPPQHTPYGNATTDTDWEFDNPRLIEICEQHQGSMTAVWFWGGLVFWFNFCLCLLLYVGQNELAMQGRSNDQYEHIGGNPPPSASSQQSSFAGAYSTIPEIRGPSGGNSLASVQHV